MLAIQNNKQGAMFRDVGHALSVAFLVMSADARQPTMLREFILQQMRSRQRLSQGQMEWYDRLLGTASAGEIKVNFSGLQFDEVRAQCAMVISATRSKLPPVEMWAVTARHSITDWEDVGGKRRYAFSAEKASAIHNLTNYLLSSIGTNLSQQAMDCLIARYYANHSKTKISVRDLERSFGIGKSTFDRAAKKIKTSLLSLEAMAEDRLAHGFIASGIAECKRIERANETTMTGPVKKRLTPVGQ